MGHTHLLSACVFCFLCLTHIHCSENAAHVIKAKVAEELDRSSAAAGEPPRSILTDARNSLQLDPKSLVDIRQELPLITEEIYVEKLFKKYENSAHMLDLNGFKKMLENLGLHQFDRKEENLKTNHSHNCFEASTILERVADNHTVGLNKKGLVQLCPFLLYNLLEADHCHEAEETNLADRRLYTWLYASGSVIIISLCGLLGVFVIPVMGKAIYQKLLQFLVALAIGTLCGDALLHLLPHALVPDHSHGPTNHDHESPMWMGLAALLGIIFFFFTEKILMLCTEWRKKRQRSRRVQGHSHVQILNGDTNETVGEKSCKHKYSSYPFCYPDIKNNMDGHEHGEATTAGQELLEGRTECMKKADEYDVIVREHTTTHHGHSHFHGHVHSAPESMSSVAWMVILGDGLHNFTDGMAIGAAFSNNIAGGCSTAVAVFCHELPHELGDFAVLLKTGMSAKQAVFYNMISSVLCFGGMILGMFVGSEPQASQWIFAVSAGMFLYIALVDMFPEMTTNHSTVETTLCQCCLQGFGLITGAAVMLVIAYFENHLLQLFG